MAKGNRIYVCVHVWLCVQKYSALLMMPEQDYLMVNNDFSFWFVFVTISMLLLPLP